MLCHILRSGVSAQNTLHCRYWSKLESVELKFHFKLNILKHFTDLAPTKKDAESWVNGLKYLIEKIPHSYQVRMDIWLAKEFETMISPGIQHRFD